MCRSTRATRSAPPRRAPAERREMMAEWAEVMLTAPASSCFAAPSTISRRRRRHRCLLRHHRRAASREQVQRRSFRQARRQRPRLERAGKTLPSRAEAFARYYANEAIAMVCRGLAGDRLSDHLAGQLRQSRRRGAVGASRLSHGLPVRRGDRGLPRPRPPAFAGADLAGRGRALRHAGRDRPDAVPAVLADVTRRAISPGASPNSSNISTGITSSCRSKKGDAAFFNPALFHAAGHNRTTRRAPHRQPLADLLGLWPRDGIGRSRQNGQSALSLRCAAGLDLDARARANVIAACAEGYAFPTNLDRDPPLGGLAPQTQAQLMRRR